MNLSAAKAVFRKELVGYFSNPSGYVFITLFVFLSGMAAFWTEAFFVRNLANMDQLNAYYPLLLLFLIPSITMASWAEERKQGTDELLLTLPAREGELMLGKYLGCVAIYTVCLLFAASHVLVLVWLGKPDIGLMFSTYLGYWLAGVGLCGMGLAASVLSASPTISFIASALVCGALVSIGLLSDLVPASAGAGFSLPDALRELSVPRRLESFGRGVIDPANIAYFVGMGLLGVWFATRIISGRRSAHRAADTGLHTPLRAVCIAAVLVCAVVLLQRTGVRADATAERLWSMSPQTRELIGKIPAEKPIVIHAYVSPRVPASMVQQRETLVGLLNEVQAIGRGRIQVQITPTEPNTEQARDADRSYGIKPRSVVSEERAGGAVQEVFLGLAVGGGGGAEPSVIPFLSPGLPVEYELARALRAAGTEARKKIGVLDTDAALFAKFDFRSMQPGRDWPIITELRKQYKVDRVSPTADVPKDIDVLLVAQPSSLTPPELEKLLDYIKAGRPAIIFEDPFPIVNPGIASSEPRTPANPMMGGDPRSQQPKADLKPLWDLIGARVQTDSLVWDNYNPQRILGDTPEEFIWLTTKAPDYGPVQPFNEADPISSGLQQMVMLFCGRIDKQDRKADAAGAGNTVSGPELVPLLRSRPISATMPYASLMQRSMFGPQMNPNRRPTRTMQSQILAAASRGKSGDANINVVLVADLDMISETFFQLREQGGAGIGLDFDNVTFVLNAVDTLAGDNSLLELRKKRRVYRTLETVEKQRNEEIKNTDLARTAAESQAVAEIEKAQNRLNEEVKKVQDRTDLDESSKRILVETVRRAEERRVKAQTAAVEDHKKQEIEDARLTTKAKIDRIQMGIRIAAVTLPPVPALAIGLFVMGRRRTLERESGKRERTS